MIIVNTIVVATILSYNQNTLRSSNCYKKKIKTNILIPGLNHCIKIYQKINK